MIDLSILKQIKKNILFIEWFSKPNKKDVIGAEKFVMQMDNINEALKSNRQICIWDIDRSITYEEMKWFISKDVRLFEPYLITRTGFEFLPDPIIEQDLVLSNFTQNRDIAYGYYETLDNKQYSVDLYNINPTILNSYENVKLAIAFDTKTNYEAGYLNPKIFEMMYQGAVIALPQEHKFFHSLFTHQVISPDDFVSIKWLLSCYQNISYGCAVDVTIKLKNEWNILTEKYFLDVLNGL